MHYRHAKIRPAGAMLRKSLGKYSNYIVTLRGVGYRFEEL